MDSSEKLTPAELISYRSLVMTLACIGQDSVDIAEAVTCLMRHMKEPRCGHMMKLKRESRCLTNSRRCVSTYPRQMSDVSLQVQMDSYWARDMHGRKSTTTVIVRGKHLWRHTSCVQTHVAFLSGEDEYYALIRGAYVRTQPHHQGWMIDVSIDICSHSFRSTKCCAETRNWRTSETLADTPLVATESSSWSYGEVVAGEHNPADTYESIGR